MVRFGPHTSFYCGSIIVGLLLTSCYVTSSEPATSLEDAWWAHTQLGAIVAKIIAWFASPATPAVPAWTEAQPCTTCWTEVGLRRGFFTPIARQPPCETKGDTSLVAPAPSSFFVGVPGTALGFYLDLRLFLPRH